MPITFTIHARSATTHARAGVVSTPHGDFPTPAFMPVGTKATVKGILPGLVAQTGASIILANTYHLMLRPGEDLIAPLGGLHPFVNWNGPILTDSGGFQAFSMADITRLSDDGVRFRSVVDGSLIDFTPERAMHVQNKLGADIIMAFDDCPPSVDPADAPMTPTRRRLNNPNLSPQPSSDNPVPPRLPPDPVTHHARVEAACDRTARWLERCRRAHARPHDQALFGIVQGGTYPDLRTRSVEQVCSIDLPGYAIGGVAVGEDAQSIEAVVRHTAPLLPLDKPRYLMGVGYERDLLAAVRAGVDMFDCVLPTRNGRNASAFTPTGPLRLRNSRFASDDLPIEPGCDCPACCPALYPAASNRDSPFTRAYIRHLFFAEEMLGPILVTLHNLRYFQRFMADVRDTIRTDDWFGLVRRWPVAASASAARSAGDPSPGLA